MRFVIRLPVKAHLDIHNDTAGTEISWQCLCFRDARPFTAGKAFLYGQEGMENTNPHRDGPCGVSPMGGKDVLLGWFIEGFGLIGRKICEYGDLTYQID